MGRKVRGEKGNGEYTVYLQIGRRNWPDLVTCSGGSASKRGIFKEIFRYTVYVRVGRRNYLNWVVNGHGFASKR